MNSLIPNDFLPSSDPHRVRPGRPGYGSAQSIPYDGQTRMRFTVVSGLSTARVRVDPNADALVTLQCDGEAPELHVTGSELRLVWPLSFADWWRRLLHAHYGETEIVLHPVVTWELVVRGGLSSLEGDLRAGSVSSIEVSGGCSNVELRLPKPAETVPINITGGASHLRLSRPSDVGVAVAVTGGISSLRLDDQRFDSIGGSAQLETPVHIPGSPRYDIRVTGGASNVRVEGPV